MNKNCLDNGDLDPIFQVTTVLRNLQNGLYAPYFVKGWLESKAQVGDIILSKNCSSYFIFHCIKEKYAFVVHKQYRHDQTLQDNIHYKSCCILKIQ